MFLDTGTGGLLLGAGTGGVLLGAGTGSVLLGAGMGGVLLGAGTGGVLLAVGTGGVLLEAALVARPGEELVQGNGEWRPQVPPRLWSTPPRLPTRPHWPTLLHYSGPPLRTHTQVPATHTLLKRVE